MVHSLSSLLFEGVAGFQCLVLLFYPLFMTYHSAFDLFSVCLSDYELQFGDIILFTIINSPFAAAQLTFVILIHTSSGVTDA